MATVINRQTKKVIKSVNTPDYSSSQWIINPELPNCDKKYWVIEEDIVREMNSDEKYDLNFSTNSNVYIISRKELITKTNGNLYLNNLDVIINPVMPNCDIKYTKAVAGKVVEMSDSEKNEVDNEEYNRNREVKIVEEIRKVYSINDELKLIALGIENKINKEYVEYRNYVNNCKLLYQKK